MGIFFAEQNSQLKKIVFNGDGKSAEGKNGYFFQFWSHISKKDAPLWE